MRNSYYGVTHVRDEKCRHSRKSPYEEIAFSIRRDCSYKKEFAPSGLLLLREVPILKRGAIDENLCSFSRLPLLCVTISAFWLRQRVFCPSHGDGCGTCHLTCIMYLATIGHQKSQISFNMVYETFILLTFNECFKSLSKSFSTCLTCYMR